MNTHNNASKQFPEALLRQALEDISVDYGGKWCLERKLLPSTQVRHRKKRKATEETIRMLESNSASSNYHNLISATVKGELGSPLGCFQDPLGLSVSTPVPSEICSDVGHIANRLICNSSSCPLFLRVVDFHSHMPITFMVPPHSSFFLSTINHEIALAMSMAVLTMYPEPSSSAGRGQFDFIVLDPPWENRSVKRAAKYKTMQELAPMEVLQSTLGQHIALGGLVACWITNKAIVRETALEAFDAWDVHLIEEWAWLKVTANGAPVTDLNGIWRKPYEILLLGRKRGQSDKGAQRDIQRRVIVGAPDLHSRKPNLKALIEPRLPPQYRALEIFARNLTAGWCAWGDEVLKFATTQ